MKKVVFIALGAMWILGSCKKDYNCVCNFSGGGYSASLSEKINDTRRQAKKRCEANNNIYVDCGIE